MIRSVTESHVHSFGTTIGAAPCTGKLATGTCAAAVYEARSASGHCHQRERTVPRNDRQEDVDQVPEAA